MRLKVVALLISLFPMFAMAGWGFVNKVDDFTDQQVMYAAYSDDEHRIQLSHEGDSVWMFITRKKIGTFEPNGIIELRVDDNKSLAIDPVKSKRTAKLLGISTFQWEPSTVGFLIWHGKENEGCGYIGQLLEGKKLKGRYQTNSMERDTFQVSLDGAKEAIISGLGLNICGK